MSDTIVRECQSAKLHSESILPVRLDDKRILHVGITHIQQIASFVQKANLKFLDPPRILALIGDHASHPETRLFSGLIQRCAQHNKITPMPSKTATTRAFFIRCNPGNCPNRHNDENCRWSADQQLLSPQHIPTLFRATEWANLCRRFDYFSTKRTNFDLFVVGHKLQTVFFHGCNGGDSKVGAGGGSSGNKYQNARYRKRPGNAALKSVPKTQTTRTRDDGKPKYFASPPQTPAMSRSSRERQSFIYQVASSGVFRLGRPMKK